MNWQLYKSFHARGLDQAKLAALTGINRSVLSRILTNEHGRGKESRVKIFQHLLPVEILILGWADEYVAWMVVTNQSPEKKAEWKLALQVQEKITCLKSDIETDLIGGMEQSATENIAPSIQLLCGDKERHDVTGEIRTCSREQGHDGWHHSADRTESWPPNKPFAAVPNA